MVADAARAALLIDQPGQLGARVAGDPGEIPPDQALPGPRQPEVIAEPDQRPLNERVRRLPVVGGDLRGLAPAEEGADVVERANPFGCRVSRSCSHDLLAPRFMLTSRWKPAPRSCSLLIGQRSDWRC